MLQFNEKYNKVTQWKTLVEEAQSQSGYIFEEALQHYLVITLDHFSRDTSLGLTPVSVDYLQNIEAVNQENIVCLRKVGDECLLISGLFPERIKRKNVTLDYFVTIGQQAYQSVANTQLVAPLDPQLFNKLSNNFVGLMDLLHTMRHLK